jgi:hypothetical protein
MIDGGNRSPNVSSGTGSQVMSASDLRASSARIRSYDRRQLRPHFIATDNFIQRLED